MANDVPVVKAIITHGAEMNGRDVILTFKVEDGRTLGLLFPPDLADEAARRLQAGARLARQRSRPAH